jgi:hypothetical protein
MLKEAQSAFRATLFDLHAAATIQLRELAALASLMRSGISPAGNSRGCDEIRRVVVCDHQGNRLQPVAAGNRARNQSGMMLPPPSLA